MTAKHAALIAAAILIGAELVSRQRFDLESYFALVERIVLWYVRKKAT